MTITDRIAGLNQGVALKAPCRVVTTAEVVLYGLQTINGVALAAGDRVLVKDQSNTVQNGIWVASATAWARAKDFNGPRDAVKGTLVYAGAPNDGAFYSLQTPDPVMIGTDAITFIPFLFADPADVAALLAIAADISTVAGIETDVTTVAGIALDVTTVAALSADVQAVAAVVADITACAADLPAIQAAPQAAQDAADARDLAEKWAAEDEDVEVVPGKYSAYHWAQKALDAVAGSITAALVSFNNATSGLTATNVQDALDEVVSAISGVVSSLGSMAGEDAADYTKTAFLGGLASKNKAQAGDIDSQAAAAGQVLRADGSGGAAWQDPTFGLGRLINKLCYTCPSQTCTISVASPAVITYPNTGRNRPENGCPVRLTTTGALPTGLSTGVTYYVVNSTGSTSNLSLTPGGSPIVTTGAGSGTHTIQNAPYEKGINNPSFIEVTVVGTGGNTSTNCGAAGGGAAKKKILNAALSASETVTTGLIANSTSGTGGTSSFGSHCSATGGTGNSGTVTTQGGEGTGGDVNVRGTGGSSGQSSGNGGGGMGGLGMGAGANGGTTNGGQMGVVIVEEYA